MDWILRGGGEIKANILTNILLIVLTKFINHCIISLKHFEFYTPKGENRYVLFKMRY